MVVAQLVEQLLAIPEVRSSNPVIGKNYIEHLFTVNCNKKTKINENEAANAPFRKSSLSHSAVPDRSSGTALCCSLKLANHEPCRYSKR